MELYAAGHNAWRQLVFSRPADDNGDDGDDEPADLPAFVCVLADPAAAVLAVLRADRSSTIVRSSAGLRRAGTAAATPWDESAAEAANGRVAVAVPAGGIRELVGGHHARFLAATTTTTTTAANNSAAVVAQVAAGATHFVARAAAAAAPDDDDDVAVWTWGDERFRACLARAGPADAPGVVPDLRGLPTGPVVKVAAGGYAAAALTAGRDCYVWGCGAAFLSPVPTPLDLDARDVLDVSLGDDHIIAVTDDGAVWAVGDNGSGQLGLGEGGALRLTEWTRLTVQLPPGREVVGVAAAPRASFLLVKIRDS